MLESDEKVVDVVKMAKCDQQANHKFCNSLNQT